MGERVLHTASQGARVQAGVVAATDHCGHLRPARQNESAAPLAASLWTRVLSLPIFCSERQLQASGEWLRYLSFVYLSGTLSFPIDTRPFTMFYPGPLLPSAVASATVHRAEGVRRHRAGR